MSKRFHLDFSTAYGQLILLVFLPISALALTGGFLVLSDTSRAARTIQQSTADNLLVTLQPVAASMQTNLIKINQSLSTTSTQPNSNNGSSKDGLNKDNLNKHSANKADLSPKELAALQANVKFALQNAINDKHLQGVAIVNEQSNVLVSFGDLSQQPNPRLLPFLGRHLEAQSNTQQTYLLTQLNTQSNSLFNSKGSSLFGRKLVLSAPANATSPLPTLWLIVNIDNEPLQVARYQVMLALAITGLFTILLLLLTTHIYARRWIAPIYEMRLHLQRTNANNLYKPMTINASDVITLVDSMAHVGIEPQDGGSLKSPMPGQVVAFRVNVGDEVKKGQALAVIEAMKIEHTINAPSDGTVTELLFKAGDLVSDGDELLKLEGE